VLYEWDFDDGHVGSSSLPQAVHTYETARVFTVTLDVTDDLGASSSCTTTVDSRHYPTCDPGGPYESVVEELVLFDASASSDPDGDIALYAWDFGDGSTGSGTFSQVVHSYTNPGTYTVTLCVTDNDNAETCCEVDATVNESTGVGGASTQTIPTHVVLAPNRPNPFNPSTTIEFGIPTREPVRLRVYDMTGRLVATLVDEVREAGLYSVEWNAGRADSRSLPSGMYIYRLQAGASVLSRSMILVK
jgi:PKD repeat protein